MCNFHYYYLSFSLYVFSQCRFLIRFLHCEKGIELPQIYIYTQLCCLFAQYVSMDIQPIRWNVFILSRRRDKNICVRRTCIVAMAIYCICHGMHSFYRSRMYDRHAHCVSRLEHCARDLLVRHALCCYRKTYSHPPGQYRNK